MNYIAIILTALIPVAVLLVYIYRKDRIAPEPVGQLFKAFALGVLAAPLSLCISSPLEAMGLFVQDAQTIEDCVRISFFGAAIPEELAKLFILWLVLRKNRYFDEKMDGIVYAVCVSLGFAAIENLLYLFSDAESFMSIGISRALFAIPGHFCFGILMGYYYSLAKFCPSESKKNSIFVVLAPVLVHGAYDTILFVSDVAAGLSGVLTLLFLWLCYKMWKYGSKKIAEHLERDNVVQI
ncbi:MAG: PrsW family intramembrane metalloprotease [Alistipes sp.]|nr:PrsW family intramembrane metalloprotease [Alistipes sp.]